MLTEGIEVSEKFVQQYNQILLKYGDSTTIHPVTTPEASICIIIIIIIIIIVIIIIIIFIIIAITLFIIVIILSLLLFLL